MVKEIFLLITLFPIVNVLGQTHTITGKVIDDRFDPVYGARIWNIDTLLLATTEIDGNFKIEIPVNTKTLIVGSVGTEWKSIYLAEDCNNLDVILLLRPTYDFTSARKVDRLRKKDFNKLPALHKSAFSKGIFKVDKPCFTEKFRPIKNRLKEIQKSKEQIPSI